MVDRKIVLIVSWLLMVLFLLFVLIQPSVPKLLEKSGLPFNEKLLHAILFGCYYFIAVLAWKNQWKQLIVVSVFSLATEFLQTFTGRTFELADLLANMAGVILVFIALQCWVYFNKKVA